VQGSNGRRGHRAIAGQLGRPSHLALVYIVKGETIRAVSLLERSLALSLEWKLAFFSTLAAGLLGHAYAASGRVGEGLGLLQETLPLFQAMRLGPSTRSP
jgi:hypothetical protein